MTPFRIQLYIFLLLIGQASAVAQVQTREEMEIHLNSSFFLTGENLYFKLFCHNDSNAPTSISKIAYFEIINAELKPVFQTKVFLNNGDGDGYFFIPSNFATGNYTLLAYTQWMRNFGVISNVEIIVINPFDKGSSSPRATEGASQEILLGDSLSKGLSIAIESRFHTRDSVNISIVNQDPTMKYFLDVSVMVSAPGAYATRIANTSLPAYTTSNSIKFLPDLRGDIISGRVVKKADGLPLVHANVSITSVGENYLMHVSRTDSAGYFYSSIDINNCAGGDMIAQVLDENPMDYEIHVNEKFLNDYSAFKPSPCFIDPTLKSEIIKRSVFNQIENAYFNVKGDSLVRKNCPKRFYEHADKVYELDRFTRFPTVEDILRELIPEVVASSKNKKIEMKVRDIRNKGIIFSGKPLILLDGVPIVDQSHIMSYDALLLRKVEVVSKRFFYSSFQADGIVSFETFEGNAQGLNLDGAVKFKYIPIQEKKIMYSPDYKLDQNTRTPDFRIQLYWNPELELSTTTHLRFFISDIESEFLIQVRGHRSDGRPVNITRRITIKD